MNFIASLEPHVVMYILSSISEGLTALGKKNIIKCTLFGMFGADDDDDDDLDCSNCVLLSPSCRYNGMHGLLL